MFRLLNPAGREHLPAAPVNPVPEDGIVPHQHKRTGVLSAFRLFPCFLKFRHLPSGQAQNFIRADQLSAVIAEAFVILRSLFPHDSLKFGKTRFAVKRFIQLSAQFFRGGKRIQSVEKRAEIKPGSACDNRDASAPPDVRNALFRIRTEAVDIVFFRNIGNVDQMVRHPAAFLPRGFCGSPVKSPVDLHGIGGNDFPAQPKRKPDCQFAFPGRGRSHQNRKRRGLISESGHRRSRNPHSFFRVSESWTG